MVGTRRDAAARLRTALRWLQSHERRLSIQKRSLEDQLAETETAIARLKLEIAGAEQRLADLHED